MSSLDDVLAPSYLDGLVDKSLDDVRAMRNACQQVETGVSYLRRLSQGRLDIVNAELQRRQDGGAREDLAELIGRLPDILAEHGRGPDSGRPILNLEPSELPPELVRELDGIVNDGELGELPDFDAGELQDLADRLTAFEELVSTRRRALHECIDALQDEIKRRYRDGEASVESLLQE